MTLLGLCEAREKGASVELDGALALNWKVVELEGFVALSGALREIPDFVDLERCPFL